jgi:two-component system NarL family sensor kinase
MTDRLSSESERLLYRATQEAVRNVIRHAGASNVRVEVVRCASGASLTVADDGTGFDADAAALRAASGHVGLRGLDRLAREHGGSLRVEVGPGGRGTLLTMEVPEP